MSGKLLVNSISCNRQPGRVEGLEEHRVFSGPHPINFRSTVTASRCYSIGGLDGAQNKEIIMI